MGTWTMGPQGMFYLNSGLVDHLQLPSVIVLDEYDSGNPAVTAIMNAILEGKPLVLSNNGGKRIYRHPKCLIYATGNTNGMGDETGLYSSTTVQSFATMNRFRMFLEVDYLPAEQEIELLKRKFAHTNMPDKEIADIVKVTNLIRDSFKNGAINAVLSTRQVIHWTENLAMTGEPRRSFEYAFANILGGADRGVCMELFQRVFGAAS